MCVCISFIPENELLICHRICLYPVLVSQIVFQSGCTGLHPHCLCMRSSCAPFHLHSALSAFFTLAIVAAVYFTQF